MSGNPTALWSTDWFETLDGDRLRELCNALFSRIGYSVSPITDSELNFELSQEAPMAPRVGLCCRSESEGTEIPYLRKIDAAVSQNDHGFGIVVKNGSFRPEEKMFAQGKPLQLIDSEEFVKKLLELSAEDQETLSKEFNVVELPPPAAPDSTQQEERGSSDTPDFIKKLENVPGFGNKKRNDAPSSNPTPAAPPSEGTAESPSRPTPQGSPRPVEGLNLSTTAPSTPAANAQPAPAPSPAPGSAPSPALTPIAQSLPPNQTSGSEIQSPPGQSAMPPARTPDPDPVAASAAPPVAPSGNEPPPSGERPLMTRPAPSTAASPPTGEVAARNEGSQQEAASTDAPSSSETAAAEGSPSAASVLSQVIGSSASGSSQTPSTTPDSTESSEGPSEPEPESKSEQGPPPNPDDDSGSDSSSENMNETKRSPAAMVAAAVLLLIPVVGGFFAFKFIFGGSSEETGIVEAPPQLKLPEIDNARIDELSKKLAEGITNLRQVTAEIEGREAAVRVAAEAIRARQAGIDFVAIGDQDLKKSIAAVIQGKIVDDPSHPENGKTFGSLNLGEVSDALIANYLVLEDGLLKFTMEARDPRFSAVEEIEDVPGQELLEDLEGLLNRQHVVSAQNNAKSLAEVANVAKKAGLDFTAAGRRNIEKTVAAIVTGEKISNYMESGEDAFFGLPNLSSKAQRAAGSYLHFKQGELVYISEPDPAPTPAFDLIGKDPVYDLERGESIAEKAVAHVQGRIPAIEADAAALALKQEAILALTGEPENVSFGYGSMALLLPRDYSYELEDDDSLLITPKYAPNKDAIWLRIRTQAPEVIAGPNGEMGAPRLKALAKSLGRPVERLGDKIFYWKNDEVLEGDLLYWVTSRHIGFGKSMVLVADATAVGMEDLPEVARLQSVLPGIIASLRETGAPRRKIEAVDIREPSVPEAPEKPLLPGRAVPPR